MAAGFGVVPDYEVRRRPDVELIINGGGEEALAISGFEEEARLLVWPESLGTG